MKVYDVSGTEIKVGIPVSNDPYPHIVLGEGGHKRATWVALGKRDADGITAPRRVPCPNRRQAHYETLVGDDLPKCQKCGELYAQVGSYACHPDCGKVDGPACVFEAGVIQMKDAEGKPDGKYLIVAPRGNGDNRALILWRVSSGYRGSAEIGIERPTLRDAIESYEKTGDPVPDLPVVIASDSGWHSGRGSLGETAEALAILKPGQELIAHRSGRRVQDTHGRLSWDGENISVTFGGSEMFAAISDEVEGEYL